MRLTSFGFLCILFLVISSCGKTGDNSELGAAPEYVLHEALMTRNPATGQVEREKLWAYLLSQKSTMGKSGAMHKRIVYPNSWKPVDDFFASLAVQRLVFDPNNTQVMYFCTGEGWNNADAARGAGVWKSNDGGESWNQLASTVSDTFWY
ncbi:MAG: hypothetical protein ACI8SE_002277, partial [Bacteroidia bacterium]